MPKLPKREVAFHLVMNNEERDKLHELASHKGVSAADVLRIFIRDEYQRHQEEPPHHKVHGNAKKRARAKP